MNIRKTTLARFYASLIGAAPLVLKRELCHHVCSFGPHFARRVETYIYEYIADQTYARLARN